MATATNPTVGTETPQPATLSDVLRPLVARSIKLGLPGHLSVRTGVSRSSIYRFAGGGSIDLRSADRLAAYYKLALICTRPATPKATATPASAIHSRSAVSNQSSPSK